MRALVTGGAGMIGFHMANKLYEEGHDVVVVDNLERSSLLGHNKEVSEERRRFNSEKLKERGIEFLEMDVSKEETFRGLEPCQWIVHCAAQCGVPTSIADPARDWEVNANGTFHALEAARRWDSRLVYASTNKVYNLHGGWILDNGRWRWHKKEWHDNGFPLDGGTDLAPIEKRNWFTGSRTPYGNSKYAGDLLCQEYWHMYRVPTGVFRMSCIYGTHQFSFEEQGWLTWFVIANLKGLPINIYGDGQQVRDVLWVGDVVDAYYRFLRDHRIDHGVWNTGGGSRFTLSLNEAVEMIQNLTGRDFIKIEKAGWRPSDQKVYTSDITPLMAILDWYPAVDPETGVRSIIDWVEEHLDLF